MGEIPGKGFNPGSEVDIVANDGIIHFSLRSDVADHHLSGIDTHAHVQESKPGLLPFLLESNNFQFHFHAGPDSQLRVVGLVDGSSPDGDDFITNEFVQGSVVADDDLYHGREVLVKAPDDLLGRMVFGKRCEAADIGKEHGELFSSSPRLQHLRIGNQFFNHLRRGVATEHFLEAAFLPNLFFAELLGAQKLVPGKSEDIGVFQGHTRQQGDGGHQLLFLGGVSVVALFHFLDVDDSHYLLAGQERDGNCRPDRAFPDKTGQNGISLCFLL